MAENVFSYGEKKLLSKFLKFLSRHIVVQEDRYKLNFQLESFDPYSSDTQPVQMRLGEVVHALGFSIRYPRRIARGQAAQETSEDIFYQHIRTLPENIDIEMQGIEEGRHKQLIHQVIVDVVENSPARSPEINFLKPYMAQEELLIGQEELIVQACIGVYLDNALSDYHNSQ